ncbi:outer membrane lipoprotein carrier protein LolA [Photobacterium kishitanii]|uniref:Outer membrane lipoprotein carrier protein LolA n=1 Tax=Photobacterium kishitanii TaxID=318456 RepID=A0AAX0YSZ0_9GAMM|nr:outer membrane lipoprotein carrier protein LolA [Photobacterium kishitanii]PSU19966.1 outer membrane lipoprotein carrier protein LolA [Photobacterium kishitanii]PSV16616.1 outer membrane lipoprotein carrier protein LolA [Photobacterium kishitanii]PSW60896.1 outer membrane lipoprotein carrier protein LolA [Photobacterium kishitanii]PSX17698.1 outer membrane lipoprotein carrier protein LolA [Photobacterium kishitanii]PSX26692.1 outer membrane lipoprotein carrier protein LolA [Photobacterium k
MINNNSTALMTAIKWCRNSLLCTVFAITSLSTQAMTLGELQHTLSATKVVRGDFSQSRTMAMFNQPLLSNGEFLIAANNGLWWHQTAPMAVSLVLTNNKLSQQFDNQPPQIISAAQNPMVFYFSHIFLALFNGDTSALDQQFTLKLTTLVPDNNSSDASNSDNQWQLVLIPKQAPLNKVFTSITLQGGKFINHLTLAEIRGDKTVITFSHQRTTPATLTTEEQRVFKF